jgi:hypothetical protein
LVKLKTIKNHRATCKKNMFAATNKQRRRIFMFPATKKPRRRILIRMGITTSGK